MIRNSHRYIEAAKTELRVLQHITNADDGRSCCIHLKHSFHWNKHPCLAFKLYGPSIYTIMAKNHYRPFPEHIVKDLTIQICTAIQCMLLILLFYCFFFVFVFVACLQVFPFILSHRKKINERNEFCFVFLSVCFGYTHERSFVCLFVCFVLFACCCLT